MGALVIKDPDSGEAALGAVWSSITASVQQFNLENWVQPLGYVNFQRFLCEYEQWFWELTPNSSFCKSELRALTIPGWSDGRVTQCPSLKSWLYIPYVYMCTYIYIYIQRERERDIHISTCVYIYIYMQMTKRVGLLASRGGLQPAAGCSSGARGHRPCPHMNTYIYIYIYNIYI